MVIVAKHGAIRDPEQRAMKGKEGAVGEIDLMQLKRGINGQVLVRDRVHFRARLFCGGVSVAIVIAMT